MYHNGPNDPKEMKYNLHYGNSTWELSTFTSGFYTSGFTSGFFSRLNPEYSYADYFVFHWGISSLFI